MRSKVRQRELEHNIWKTPEKFHNKKKQRGVEPSSTETLKYETPKSDATIDYGSPQGTPGRPGLGKPSVPRRAASQPRLPIKQPDRPFRQLPKGYVPFKSNFQKIVKKINIVKKWGKLGNKDWESPSQDEDDVISINNGTIGRRSLARRCIVMAGILRNLAQKAWCRYQQARFQET